MEMKNIMGSLAETYWGRPADEAELVAMAGEAMRDQAKIAPPFGGQAGLLFDTEPAHFNALLIAESGQ